jgi:hypothetical protein
MELLEKDKTGHVLQYVLAYVLLALTVAVAALAIAQLRLSVFIIAGALTQDARWLRVVRIVNWIIPAIMWAVYVLVLEHEYRQSITRARIRSARMYPGVEEPTSRFFRFLRRFDLDMLFALFFKFFAATLVVFILLFGLERLLLFLLGG